MFLFLSTGEALTAEKGNQDGKISIHSGEAKRGTGIRKSIKIEYEKKKTDIWNLMRRLSHGVLDIL